MHRLRKARNAPISHPEKLSGLFVHERGLRRKFRRKRATSRLYMEAFNARSERPTNPATDPQQVERTPRAQI